MKDTPRPCPFCRKPPEITIIDSGFRLQFSVDCISPECACLPSTWLCDSEEEAIKAWNAGTITDEVRE